MKRVWIVVAGTFFLLALSKTTVPAPLALPVAPAPRPAPLLRGAFPQKFLTDEAVRLFLANFQLFGRYVAEKSGVQITIEPLPTVLAIEEKIRARELDFCFGFSDVEALTLWKNSPLIPFLTVSPFRDLTRNGFRQLVVTRGPGKPDVTGWQLRHVEDYGERYKGIPALYAEILVREGWPVVLAHEQTAHPNEIQVLEFGQSRDLILQVLTEPKTVAVIDEEAWLLMCRRNPKIAQTVQILDATAPIPINPLLVRSDLDRRLLARVKKTLLAMHQTPDGEEILKTLRVGRWVGVAPADYQPLEELIDRAKRLGISLKREEYASRH